MLRLSLSSSSRRHRAARIEQQSGPAPPQNRRRPLRRQRLDLARRRPQVVRGQSHPHRPHRRHQHGWPRRRPLRHRPYSASARLLSKVDWGFVLPTVFRQLGYRRKDAREYPPPSKPATEQGRRLLRPLRRPRRRPRSPACRPYGDLASFDDLATPFRCAATDLNTGAGELRQGPLFDALRSSCPCPASSRPSASATNSSSMAPSSITSPSISSEDGRRHRHRRSFRAPPPKPRTSPSERRRRSVSVMITANEVRNSAWPTSSSCPTKGLTGTDYAVRRHQPARLDAAAKKNSHDRAATPSPRRLSGLPRSAPPARRNEAVRPDVVRSKAIAPPRRASSPSPLQ